MIRGASSKTIVGYQMLGGGKFLDDQTGDRHKAFERAIADGCSYVEVYRADLLDPTWKSAVEFLNKGSLRTSGRKRDEVARVPERSLRSPICVSRFAHKANHRSL